LGGTAAKCGLSRSKGKARHSLFRCPHRKSTHLHRHEFQNSSWNRSPLLLRDNCAAIYLRYDAKTGFVR